MRATTLCKSLKMQNIQALGRIPWATDLWWRHDADRGQAEGYVGLGQATECQRHPVIPRLHKLLQEIRQEFCMHGGPTNGFDSEEYTMAIGPIPATSLLAVEGRVMHCASVAISRPPTTIYSGHRRIRVSCQWRTDAGPGEWTSTSHFS